MCESESGSQFSRANSPKAIQRKEKFVSKARRKKRNWTFFFRFLKMFHLSPKRFLYFFFFSSLTELDLINHLCPHMSQGVQTKAWVITTRGLEWNHCDTLLHIDCLLYSSFTPSRAKIWTLANSNVWPLPFRCRCTVLSTPESWVLSCRGGSSRCQPQSLNDLLVIFQIKSDL